MRARVIQSGSAAAEVDRQLPIPRRGVRLVTSAATDCGRSLRDSVTRKLLSPTALALAAALLVFALPHCQSLLIYDQEAILAGELWRLFTGHWVHFSAMHLGCNLAVLAVAGLILESGTTIRTAQLLLLAPWFISTGLLVCEPQLRRYGGLSGLATAAVIALAIDAFARRRQAPLAGWTAALLLLLFGLKTGLEWHTQRALFALEADAGYTIVPLSHLLGGLAALLLHRLAGSGCAGDTPANGSRRFKATTD